MPDRPAAVRTLHRLAERDDPLALFTFAFSLGYTLATGALDQRRLHPDLQNLLAVALATIEQPAPSA